MDEAVYIHLHFIYPSLFVYFLTCHSYIFLFLYVNILALKLGVDSVA